MKAILLLLVVAAFLLAAYELFRLIKKKINPHQSGWHLLLYFLLHLVVVFVCSFLAGVIIIKYSYFFFVK
jgi:uncharacterized membrane protein